LAKWTRGEKKKGPDLQTRGTGVRWGDKRICANVAEELSGNEGELLGRSFREKTSGGTKKGNIAAFGW